MGIEETILMARDSIYWVNSNTCIENGIKNYSICIEFLAAQPKTKLMLHDIPGKPWKSVGADIFMLDNKTYMSIVDYHSKFWVVKLMHELSANSLIKIVNFK